MDDQEFFQEATYIHEDPRMAVFFSSFYAHDFDSTGSMERFFRNCRKVCGASYYDRGSHLYSEPHVEEYAREMAKHMIGMPGFIDYIADKCVSEITGPMSAEMRNEVIRLLQDPDYWKLDQSLIQETTLPMDRKPPHVDSHRSGSIPGALRCGFSFEKMPDAYEGLFAHRSGLPFPVVNPINGMLLARRRRMKKKTFYAWTSDTGVHAIPQITRPEIAAWGGKRELFTFTYKFNHLARQAIMNIEMGQEMLRTSR